MLSEKCDRHWESICRANDMSNEAKRVTNDRSWSDRFRLLSLLKAICMKFSGYNLRNRDIVQLVERWSPKPNVEGSSPSVPVKVKALRTL